MILHHRGYDLTHRCPAAEACAMLDAILDERIDVVANFKNDAHSRVTRFHHDERDLVLKVPRARNRRMREWLFSLLRGSPAARAFLSQERLIELGFHAPPTVLLAERRRWGLVVDSLFVSEFVAGTRVDTDALPAVAGELLRLHHSGHIRRDAQAGNFILHNGAVVFIDCTLRRPRLFNRLVCAQELVQFLRSHPQGRPGVPAQLLGSKTFRLAWTLSAWHHLLRKLRRGVRLRLRLQRR